MGRWKQFVQATLVLVVCVTCYSVYSGISWAHRVGFDFSMSTSQVTYYSDAHVHRHQQDGQGNEEMVITMHADESHNEELDNFDQPLEDVATEQEVEEPQQLEEEQERQQDVEEIPASLIEEEPVEVEEEQEQEETEREEEETPRGPRLTITRDQLKAQGLGNTLWAYKIQVRSVDVRSEPCRLGGLLMGDEVPPNNVVGQIQGGSIVVGMKLLKQFGTWLQIGEMRYIPVKLKPAKNTKFQVQALQLFKLNIPKALNTRPYEAQQDCSTVMMADAKRKCENMNGVRSELRRIIREYNLERFGPYVPGQASSLSVTSSAFTNPPTMPPTMPHEIPFEEKPFVAPNQNRNKLVVVEPRGQTTEEKEIVELMDTIFELHYPEL